jgi:hypothetical protein
MVSPECRIAAASFRCHQIGRAGRTRPPNALNILPDYLKVVV